MKDAKAHVKKAQNALNAMMAGSQAANSSQVTGNITLAVNAMNKMNSNGAMVMLMSMSQSMQADAKSMGSACAST